MIIKDCKGEEFVVCKPLQAIRAEMELEESQITSKACAAVVPG